MAGGIFGFEDQPQSGSVSPRQVGAILQQRQQGYPESQSQADVGMKEPPTISRSLVAGEGQLGPSMESQHARLRAIGAALAGGSGAVSDQPLTEHSATATNVAIAEAMTRLGNGGNPNRANILKSPENMRRLKALGMSDVELELLSRSGAI